MPKKQKQFKYKCLELLCNAVVRHDKWSDHCKKKHCYKFKNKLEIKYKTIEVKWSNEEKWKPYNDTSNYSYCQPDEETIEESITPSPSTSSASCLLKRTIEAVPDAHPLAECQDSSLLLLSTSPIEQIEHTNKQPLNSPGPTTESLQIEDDHPFHQVLDLNSTDKIGKVMLCTLVFQCVSAAMWKNVGAQATIDSVTQTTDFWSNYRIARSAARYGHLGVCAKIVGQLCEHTSSEHLHFWLLTLEELSEGESCLRNSYSLIDRLGAATSHYYKALAAVKAASTPSQSLSFQSEYMRLRCEMLQCLAQLVATCKSFCTAPPPAIAATIVQTTRDDLQRFGNITNRLRKCIKDFQTCGELYWNLYQSAFDADPSSLNNIQILQHTCALMAYNIECVAVTSYQGDEPGLDASLQRSCLETQLMVQSCQQASTIGRSIDKSIKPITHLHLEGLTKQVEVILEGSLCLPRYFFQVLQSTSVKLAVTPQPRVNGEYLSVQAGSQLAVKVEGVIQHGTHPGRFRSVSGVVLTLSSQLTSRPTVDNKVGPIKPGDGQVVLRQSVTPHRDFFTGQFLLMLAGGGQHQVTVEAAVQDNAGNVWNTGPRSSLTVKTLEDTSTNRPRTSL